MKQENINAMANTDDEREEQSRMERASNPNTTPSSLYHTGQSSGNFPTTSSAASSAYYFTRIQSMIENRRNFSSEVEFDIEYSRDHHWSELANSDTDNASTRLANREHFEELKKHPQWGGFFKSVKVVVGQKINEGGQAEIYDAKVEFEDGRKSPDYGYHVVKVMKGDCPLQDFQRQWPVGMLCNASQDRVKGPLMWIEGGTMIDNRFAFVMLRQWGDLRKLIDMKKQLNNNEGPPFENLLFIKKVMLCIARDMDTLHRKHGIVHRDFKASNVLLWSFGEELPDENTHVKANVVDYECSVGVVGTGFWRAPEILQQLKNRIPVSEVVFTNMTDVYSYGMTCYELLTGRLPFKGHPGRDYDFVLNGNRPELLVHEHTQGSEIWDEIQYVRIIEIMERCWNHEPFQRPTFLEIVSMLEMFEIDKGIREEERLFLVNLVENRKKSLFEIDKVIREEARLFQVSLRNERTSFEAMKVARLSYWNSISKLEEDEAGIEKELRSIASLLERAGARIEGLGIESLLFLREKRHLLYSL